MEANCIATHDKKKIKRHDLLCIELEIYKYIWVQLLVVLFGKLRFIQVLT